MKIKNKKLVAAVCFAVFVVLGGCWLLYKNITFNFVILSILLLFGFIFLGREYEDRNNNNLRALAILFVAITVLGVCKTFSNYFYADNEVYSNSDHHAVRVEGVKLLDPNGFILAGNSDEAFLDNEKYHGALTIKRYDSESVTLKADGFTQAFYYEKYKKLKRDSVLLVNQESLISLQADDKIQLIGNDGYCVLSWFYRDKDTKWYQKKRKECKYVCEIVKDTSRYIDTVSYTNTIKKGLDLNSIYGEVISDIGFGGINLLREQYCSESEDNDYYVDKPFVLELNSAFFESGIREIRVLHSTGSTTSYLARDLRRKTQEITIPIGTAFSIGCVYEGRSSSLRFRMEDEQLFLDYVNPQYHLLSSVNSEGSNNICITSSLLPIVQDQNLSQNIVLFDMFYNDENVNHFKKPIFLSYISGPTTQEMCFLVNREININPNEYISGVLSRNDKVEWKMYVENFKNTINYLDENNIIIFFIVLGGCIVMCMSFGRFGKNHSLSELLAYLLMMLLFAFRMLLLWRAAMFPPVEMATAYELNQFFWNHDMIVWQFIGLNFFFAVILSVKLLSTNEGNKLTDILYLYIPMLLLIVAELWLFDLHVCSGKMKFIIFSLPAIVYIIVYILFVFFTNEKIDEKIKSAWANLEDGKSGKFYLVVIVFYMLLAGILLISLLYAKSLLKILIPISVYFLLEAIVWKYWPANDGWECYIGESARNAEGTFGLKDILSSGLGLSLLNGLSITFVLVILDGGYGIMFLSFFMFVTIVKLYDFILSYIPNQQRIEKRYMLSVLALVVFCALFFFFYKSILAFFATNSFILCSLVVFASLIGLMWVFFYCMGKKLDIFVLVGMSLFFAFILTLGIQKLVLRNHTQQRVNVFALSLEDGLKNTNTVAEERRFFEASVNDYILNVYNEQSEKVSIVGDGGTAYFKMQPHSKVGAMFGAQASDILLARFVIAEHGKWLPLIFVALVLYMFYWGIKMKTKYRASKMLLVQIPGLLFMHMLFVWLANTRLFIFLGQDFPLLSLHSKLAILYFFVLLAVWVSVAIMEKIMTANVNETIPYYYKKVGSFFVTAMAGMIILFVYVYSHQANEKRYDNAVYSLEKLLEETTDKMEIVNEYFDNYQNGSNISVTDLSDVSKIISDFNDNYKDSIRICLDGENSFHYRMWDKFAVKGGAKKNTSASLIHVRRKNEKLKLEVREKFFDQNLPVVDKNSWHGNVVAHKESVGRIDAVSQNASFKQYVIPSNWVVAGDEVIILKNRRNVGAIINNDSKLHSDFKVDQGYTSACRRFAQDRLDSYGLENFASNTYFARSVVINGKRTFIYPMSEKFFWAYTFAKEVAYQKNRMENKDDKNFHDDVTITIDRDLSVKIYNIARRIQDGGKYISVIAADGDGQIRAMLDYKPEYVLNPNNTRKMLQVADELYMDFDSEVSDFYFGNLNLMNLKDGPGSSQKPIVWTAVASAIDYNWKDLQIYKFDTISPRKDKYSKKYYSICKFNGETIYPYDTNPDNYDEEYNPNHKTFTALTSDENYGKGVSLSDYMRLSSNYYNALMLYIGSYSSVNMDVSTQRSFDSTAMFVELPRNMYKLKGYQLREKYDESFPILTNNQNGSNLFKLNMKMSRDYKNSILFTQLYDMFGFNVGNRVCSLYEGLNLNTSVKQRWSTYAFAVSPYLKYNQNELAYDRGYLREAIHQTAVGGGVWQVSPLAMAQSFGRLVMLKKNYQLTIEPVDDKQFIAYSKDELSDGYMNARPNFLCGMNEVFSTLPKPKQGTAKSFGAQGPYPYKMDGYYIYGKTGTANETKNGKSTGHTNLHRLGIVITNKNIENMGVDSLKTVKFYTVYITSWKPQWECYKDIVGEIIKSESFKSYMEN